MASNWVETADPGLVPLLTHATAADKNTTCPRDSLKNDAVRKAALRVRTAPNLCATRSHRQNPVKNSPVADGGKRHGARSWSFLNAGNRRLDRLVRPGAGGELAGKELLPLWSKLRRRAAGLRRGARHHRLALRRKGKRVLELLAADRQLRQGAGDCLPALGGQYRSAPLLQRRGADQRRQQACGELLDRRGHRFHRPDLGRDLVRLRPRPQLGL